MSLIIWKRVSDIKLISRNKARKLFYVGGEVYALPSKVNINNMYIQSVRFIGDNFEKVENAFRYYNCNKELGINIKYYRN